jgi:cell wall-associated NlpC family hydrolase
MRAETVTDRSSIDPDRIVSAARSLLGVPHHHQGRDPRFGIDCVGLLVLVAQAVGAAWHDLEGYSGDGRITADGLGKSLLRTELERSLDEVHDIGETRDGDILCFWVSRALIPHHVGIRVGAGMIHAAAEVESGRGRVIERTRLGAWANYLDSAWRFRPHG